MRLVPRTRYQRIENWWLWLSDIEKLVVILSIISIVVAVSKLLGG